jgi:endoglycosylceramidase
MEDVNLLADLGMNMIRLDVSWAGAEPERGHYNQSYFDVVHRIVNMCKSRGIYVLLEWHQDLFSERYCGNGAPLWASRPLSNPNRFRFPWPWSKIRKEAYPNGPITEESCAGINFANGYFNFQLSQAFEDFYTNYDGVRDSFVNFWRKIAFEFKNESNVIGYEFINGILISKK